jgi:hypothetical protein
MQNRVTVTGATLAFVLAGTGVPAAGAQPVASKPGTCTAPTALGTVVCVYDDPAVQNYVLKVPAGVNVVRVAAHGAAGGDGGTLDRRVAAPHGAPGGSVSAEFPVSPGQVLRILVGERGHNADGTTAGAAGRNGGGKGGAGAPAGGGGGGASTVRLGGTDLDSRILVAGGGGGGGGSLAPTARANGGAGGGDHGEDGEGDALGPGGVGAIGPSGGAGLDTLSGQDGQDGYDAYLGGAGGEGGSGPSNQLKHAGSWGSGAVGAGGGGGGYAGGSGGASGTTSSGGGGGGSGFVALGAGSPTVARISSIEQLIGKGSLDDGLVTITYQLPIGKKTRTPAGVTAAPDLVSTPASRR